MTTALGPVSISNSPKVNKHLRLVKYHKSSDLKSVSFNSLINIIVIKYKQKVEFLFCCLTLFLLHGSI